MRIAIAAPVRPGATSGNEVTAARWQRRLAELGHDVTVQRVAPELGEGYVADAGADVGGDADVLVVLHARRCARIVAASRAARAERPVVVGLAGTDLYVDLPDDADARAAVDAADGLVVLQAKAIDRLRSFDPSLADRTTVVHQSVEPPLPRRVRDGSDFVVVVLAHLRDVKDPLLAAAAVRRLPSGSRAVVVHAGAAHDGSWAAAAEHEVARNQRYRWLGEVSRDEALHLLASADVLACTSRLEGGANVVSEAIALGVPVIGTAVDGTTGLLGDDHPDLVPVGDDAALAGVIARLESDAAAYAEAERRIAELRRLTDPAHERAAWARVLDRLVAVGRP
jgi:putative glycosyltransferase (TIGR04348 family)